MRGLRRAAIQGVLGMVVICAAAGVAQAAVFPYTNDFSSTALTNAAPAGNWSLSGGNFNNVVTTTTATPTASEQVTGVAGNDFVVSTRFTLNSVTPATTGFTSLGFGILATDGAFSSTGGNTLCLLDWSLAGPATVATVPRGNLRILKQGGGSFASSATGLSDGGGFVGNSVPLGTEFLLKVTGTYSGGSLTLTFGVWNSAGTAQIGTSATATDSAPLTGQFFGFRNRNPNTTASYNASFNDFNVVAVPEPTFSAAALAAGGLMLRRRRRDRSL